MGGSTGAKFTIPLHNVWPLALNHEHTGIVSLPSKNPSTVQEAKFSNAQFKKYTTSKRSGTCMLQEI